jgi:ABC-type multidrug transport system fused ATPase/permease subunit
MALLGTFWKDWAFVASIAIVCECVGIYYSIFIMYLAEYIRDESMHYSRGIWLIALFLFMNMFVIILRNRYIQYGYMTSIKMRRTLVAVMFDKVGVLSVESLQKTNGAKIITLISADLFALER